MELCEASRLRSVDECRIVCVGSGLCVTEDDEFAGELKNRWDCGAQLNVRVVDIGDEVRRAPVRSSGGQIGRC